MSLYEKLSLIEDLSIDTEIIVSFVDGEYMIGKYKGYTSAENNEPEVEQIDIETNDGTWFGLEAPEIETITKHQK